MIRSIVYSMRCLAGDILDPHIKNPLPAIREEAEGIYQDFIASEESKSIYEDARKKHPGAFACMVEEILTSLRGKISGMAGDDPDKSQLLNAYLRDKISEGLR